MRKGLGGVNCLTTAHLIGSGADMYGLTLYAVDLHTIVTKSVMSIAHACRQILIIARFSSMFEPRSPELRGSHGLGNAGLGDRA